MDKIHIDVAEGAREIGLYDISGRLVRKASKVPAGVMEMDLSTLTPMGRPKLLYYGSYGRSPEGPHLVKKDGWYYLFASKGSCCNHEKSSYRLVVARSRNIFGPYKGPDGQKMTSGSFDNVIMEGGGQFIGTGHCSQIVTDDAGQQWMAYHSYWNGNGYISRCLCIDRIDWTEDGWPWFPDASGSPSVFSVASPGTDVPVPAFN